MSLYLGNQKVTPTIYYKDNKKFTQLVDGSISELTAEDLKDITSIRNYGLSRCSNLTSVTIPDSVTSIGSYAFSSCSKLASVIIGNSVTSIGEGAFYGIRITSVIIPDSVTSIGEYSFYKCSSLTSVTIGNSVTSIGYAAFDYCDKLKNIHITDLAVWCKISRLHNLMNYGSNNKNLYLNGELVTNLTIPDSVTSIGNDAFYGCSGLTSVTIPDSVTSIGSYAFYYCSGLTGITIPDSVTSIGNYAFGGCSGLTSITMLPTNPPTLGSDAIPSNVTTITVPSGTGDAYKAATNWSAFADKIQEAAV